MLAANGRPEAPTKTDCNDARGIAQLMRLGWFRPVHCKSIAAQETRALLTARKLVQVKLHDIEMSLRGILRGFGLKVGPTTPVRFEGRIRELVAGASEPGGDRAGPVGGTCGAAARVRPLREAGACHGPLRYAGKVIDVGAWRRCHRVTHFRGGD